jgi:hypothetical protein
VLDDLTPLYQINADLARQPAAILKPNTVKRFRHEGRAGDPAPLGFKSYGRFGGMMGTSYQKTNEYGENVITFIDAGKNPPEGAVIHYWLANTPKGKLTLTIRDSDGKLIRRFESKTDKTQQSETEPVTGEGYEGQTSGEDAPAENLKLPANQGMNRFHWNLRYANATGVKGADIAADALAGPIAVPGTYTAELAVDGKTYSTEIVVEADPRVNASQQDLQEQFDLLMQIREKLSETHKAVNTIRDIKAQLDGWTKRSDDGGLKDQATTLRDKLVAIEEVLIQPKASDPRQFPNGLNDKLAALPGMIQNADVRPPKQYYDVFEKLSGEVDEQLGKLEDVLGKDVKAFNEAVKKADVVAVG